MRGKCGESVTVVERMDAKTDKTGSCWMWTGANNGRGYGRVAYQGRYWGAHRLAYELAYGAIPDGLVIDHICRNRGCVRPEHLQAVTIKQNAENRGGASANSRSGVRGVTWNKRLQKWAAQIGHDGRSHHVGVYDSRDDAERAALAKRNELFTNNLTDKGQQRALGPLHIQGANHVGEDQDGVASGSDR